ncbi:MAG: hypothetical protein CSA11_10115 [Chloroflexi bacterium]|nr:MAG: hypothetical protein CSB13_09900 [Chloroflexota bacterium]PIE79898.1 MAG: hypothetical protein CSA11_10115 [Chloroflexota bacterium]
MTIINSLITVLIMAFMIVGLIGVFFPILPGVFMIWLGLCMYVWRFGFEVISLGMFFFLTLILFVAGTSDLWLPIFGTQKAGAAKRTLITGMIGAIAGSFLIPLPIVGTIIGYALGILLGEYHKRRDWNQAWRASKGGLKGWGIATAVQLIAGLFVVFIFAWTILAA